DHPTRLSFPTRRSSDLDMYVRWVQLGALQPINRLHSNHGDRLPWEYSGKAARVAADFLRLRGSLGPYLYTLARTAHDTGLPMVQIGRASCRERVCGAGV